MNFELVEINKIDTYEVDNEIVYDLGVEIDHSYCVDGIIVHNSVCITKSKTGFHRPMVSTILDCCQVDIPIIADGGIKEHGDIAKSIALGATMVMAGSLFSGYDESAGDIKEIDNKLYKEYYGSASEHNKGEYKNVEGKKILIPYKGSMDKLLIELKEDLQSSISYAGGDKLFDLKNVRFVKAK